MVYDVTVTRRRRAGSSPRPPRRRASGTSTAFIDLKALRPAVGYGTFTFELAGTASISDPDTLDSDSVLGDTITFQVAQLTKQP